MSRKNSLILISNRNHSPTLLRNASSCRESKLVARLLISINWLLIIIKVSSIVQGLGFGQKGSMIVWTAPSLFTFSLYRGILLRDKFRFATSCRVPTLLLTLTLKSWNEKQENDYCSFLLLFYKIKFAMNEPLPKYLNWP